MGGYVGGGGTTLGGMASTAARAGLGIATGGTSEIIAQVLNIIPSIFQGVLGASQLKKANLLEKQNVRPEAEVAPSINKLVDYAYGRTMDSDIPGGEIARNEIKGATSAGLKAASELGSGSEAYGMLGELVGREQGGFADLARTTAEQVKGARGDYMNALGIKGQEENRVWDWNKADKYLQAAQVAQQLRDSGTKNIYAGGSNMFGSAAQTLSSTVFDDNKGQYGKDNLTRERIIELLNENFG